MAGLGQNFPTAKGKPTGPVSQQTSMIILRPKIWYMCNIDRIAFHTGHIIKQNVKQSSGLSQ